VTLSLARKNALLSWAASAGVWVIEDDYDGEFHYHGVRPPTLKSLDANARVLYGGTFSKVLFPALGLGYLVVPEKLIGTFENACRCFRRGTSGLEQAVVARFMQQGYFARHLNRMRSLYAARRKALSEALRAAFGDRLHIEPTSGGTHIIARLPSEASDAELVLLAREQGLMPDALSRHAVEHDCGQALLLAFTNIPETQAPEMAQILFEAVRLRLRRDEARDRRTRPAGATTMANLY
jgi:GntR family transcriptional regulator/MocR family aminotransferase